MSLIFCKLWKLRLGGCVLLALIPVKTMAQDGGQKWSPRPTLADDLGDLILPLKQGYAASRPRLLFGESDRTSLQEKAKQFPELWSGVLTSANRATVLGGVPTPEMIKKGDKYWQVERAESAALAWFVTGDKQYLTAAKQWLLALCRESIWGNGFRPNLDLQASWNLYHLAIVYDLVCNQLGEEDRKVIREGLASHAKAIFDDADPAKSKEPMHYDQNHTYIPTVALIAASLALLDEVPEAQDWLKRGYAILRRSRYVLGNDGYYYEGFGYWSYALHWQVRGAEMIERATDEKMFEIPFLRDNWRYALQLSLPGAPGAFNVHDSSYWPENGQRPPTDVNNYAMFWKIASATGSGESRMAGDFYQARKKETDYPAAAFLWFDPSVKPADLKQVKPYHFFEDHGVVSWRSGWDSEATCYLFRCGPPEGYSSLKKLDELKDWVMNAGHVHPNVGAFWIYAKGTYLAVETGYTSEKWTKDHNTILVDGKGQGVDGEYHNDRGVPYGQLSDARIDRWFLSDAYGFASGSFGSVYARQIPDLNLRRSVLMTSKWLLVVDDMAQKEPRVFTWLCHADAAFEKNGAAYISSNRKLPWRLSRSRPGTFLLK